LHQAQEVFKVGNIMTFRMIAVSKIGKAEYWLSYSRGHGRYAEENWLYAQRATRINLKCLWWDSLRQIIFCTWVCI
jgi:hypothetical protein